jgi:acetyl-CoA carboxylase biotin carboxyl carrier protein
MVFSTQMMQQPQQFSAAPTPIAQVPATPAAIEAPATPVATNLHTFRSPMIGTYYSAATPNDPPFIKVGDNVNKGQKLCIVEAMKLFNDIECDVTGKIVKVLVDNASPVEYDQPLFLIEKA